MYLIERRVSAMRARDKRLALALHHEEHSIVYVLPSSLMSPSNINNNSNDAMSDGSSSVPSPYPNKVLNVYGI